MLNYNMVIHYHRLPQYTDKPINTLEVTEYKNYVQVEKHT